MTISTATLGLLTTAALLSMYRMPRLRLSPSAVSSVLSSDHNHANQYTDKLLKRYSNVPQRQMHEKRPPLLSLDRLMNRIFRRPHLADVRPPIHRRRPPPPPPFRRNPVWHSSPIASMPPSKPGSFPMESKLQYLYTQYGQKRGTSGEQQMNKPTSRNTTDTTTATTMKINNSSNNSNSTRTTMKQLTNDQQWPLTESSSNQKKLKKLKNIKSAKTNAKVGNQVYRGGDDDGGDDGDETGDGENENDNVDDEEDYVDVDYDKDYKHNSGNNQYNNNGDTNKHYLYDDYEYYDTDPVWSTTEAPDYDNEDDIGGSTIDAANRNTKSKNQKPKLTIDKIFGRERKSMGHVDNGHGDSDGGGNRAKNKSIAKLAKNAFINAKRNARRKTIAKGITSDDCIPDKKVNYHYHMYMIKQLNGGNRYKKKTITTTTTSPSTDFYPNPVYLESMIINKNNLPTDESLNRHRTVPAPVPQGSISYVSSSSPALVMSSNSAAASPYATSAQYSGGKGSHSDFYYEVVTSTSFIEPSDESYLDMLPSFVGSSKQQTKQKSSSSQPDKHFDSQYYNNVLFSKIFGINPNAKTMPMKNYAITKSGIEFDRVSETSKSNQSSKLLQMDHSSNLFVPVIPKLNDETNRTNKSEKEGGEKGGDGGGNRKEKKEDDNKRNKAINSKRSKTNLKQ